MKKYKNKILIFTSLNHTNKKYRFKKELEIQWKSIFHFFLIFKYFFCFNCISFLNILDLIVWLIFKISYFIVDVN